MSNIFFANQFTLQVADGDMRIVFQDVRNGIASPPIIEHPMVGRVVGEAVMTTAMARQLRDMLVQYIKDDPTGTMQ